MKRKVMSYAMQGGAAGIAWYIWYNGIMCTHTNNSIYRHLLAHAIFGGALGSYLFMPTAFPYGFWLGLILGTLPRMT